MSGALDVKYNVYGDVERKTDVKTEPVTVTSKRYNPSKNVLNSYRSYTYNFTLAGLPKAVANDPTKYRDNFLDLIIIKSGGKGLSTIRGQDGSVVTKDRRNVVDSPEHGGEQPIAELVEDTGYAQKLIDGFNERSSGRFDMFIDNVSITTGMAFSQQSNTTFITGLSFDVFEPYGISGFIEALHVTSVAAGHLSYYGTTFLLKVDFFGYPDSDDLPKAEKIPKTERYIPFIFEKIDVEITENGTKYRCNGIPMNDIAFGDVYNKLKQPIKMSGTTVKEILEKLMAEKTQQELKNNQASRPKENATVSDEYSIKFPVRNPDGTLDYDGVNAAGKALLTKKILQNTECFSFADPGNLDKKDAYNKDNAESSSNERLEPNKLSIQFRDGTNLTDCIASVIRDSTYVSDILENISQRVDANGMVEYFLVIPEVKNLELDIISRRARQQITFLVLPYKIHVTFLPLYSQEKFLLSKFKNLVLREYDYIYTGKNTDVLSFNLKFNSLFIEVVPRALGNSEYASARDGAGKDNGVNISVKPSNVENSKKTANPTPPLATSDSADNVIQTGPNAITKTDPYSILAKNVHESILNIQGSMLEGELEIIGDPFYLVTGGIGNYRPNIERPGLTQDNELDRTYGQVLINLTFRNPYDINSLDKGGRYVFKNKASFSGLYFVKTCVSTFKDGQFKQRLNVARMLGQILEDEEISETNISDRIETRPNPLNQVVPDTAAVLKPSQRASSGNLFDNIASIASQVTNFGSTLEGAAGQFRSNLQSGINSALSPVTDFASKLSNAVRQVTDPVSEAAAKLGLTAQNLSQLTPAQILTLQAAAALIPNGVNPKELQTQGVVVNLKKLENYPPTPPKTPAPSADQNPIDLVTLLQASGNLNSAFPSGVPSAVAAAASSFQTAYTNPLENLNRSVSAPVSVNLSSIASVQDKYSTNPSSPFAKLPNVI